MEDENQIDDYGMETQDFVDASVEYVDESQQNVSSGTDFDYANVSPDKPPIPYDSHEVDYTDIEMEYAPTKTVGVAQDFMDLTKNITGSGDELAKARALEDFSQRQLARFTSPKVIGPLLLFYAYRGRFSALERVVFGAVGVGALIKGYSLAKPGQGLDHPLMKTVKGRVIG
jgi:hypothetical protein